ncbi:MAG: heme-dependent oxidative N-demethylase subunit alpha family protein [Pseudobdellovibrionaceae bacterium]
MKTPRYFPIDRGLYEVAPGLKPLGFSFGNGAFDEKIFQIDSEFPLFRENKLKCRKERLSKYIQTQDLPAESEKEIVLFLIERFQKESPELFQLQKTESKIELKANHTNDKMTFSTEGELLLYSSAEAVNPKPLNALDALFLQVPEDIALVQRDLESKKDWLSYLNLCSPSHWAAEDKIGLNFSAVHKPIPGIDRMLKVADSMIEAMIAKGPFVRFVWSFVTDTRLNHHPIAPSGEDELSWKGRSFDESAKEPFYLRIERQTTFGFPKIQASLFTIRLSFIPGSEIKADEKMRSQLSSALQSMTPESRVYKGVAHCFEALIKFLNPKT